MEQRRDFNPVRFILPKLHKGWGRGCVREGCPHCTLLPRHPHKGVTPKGTNTSSTHPGARQGAPSQRFTLTKSVRRSFPLQKGKTAEIRPPSRIPQPGIPMLALPRLPRE